MHQHPNRRPDGLAWNPTAARMTHDTAPARAAMGRMVRVPGTLAMPDTPVPILDLRKLGFDPEQMGGSLLVVSGRVGKVGNYQPEKGGPEYARADIAMYGTTAKVKFPDDPGKELVARSIHELSERSKADFVEVNCAAIPSELIESELFGHVKGAFTSAHKDRPGKFESAHMGTLFLDEVGDMSLAAQAKVLRVLQEQRLTRVGSDKPINVDVRVLAATNKDLQKAIAEGAFREDLYHRLSVIKLEIPSLEQRKEDIPLLIAHFNELIAAEQGSRLKPFEDSAVEALKEKTYKGNVRELRNVVERLLILSGDAVTLGDVKNYV